MDILPRIIVLFMFLFLVLWIFSTILHKIASLLNLKKNEEQDELGWNYESESDDFDYGVDFEIIKKEK